MGKCSKTVCIRAFLGIYLREGPKYFTGLWLATQSIRDYVPDGSTKEGRKQIKTILNWHSISSSSIRTVMCFRLLTGCLIMCLHTRKKKRFQGYSVEKSFFAFREIRTLNLRCTYQKQINVCSKAVYKNNA